MQASSIQKISVINGLRGLAIVGVIVHHSFFNDFRYGAATSAEMFPVALLMSSGWLGVNLFFFLSGFVLYLPYASGKREWSTRSETMEFYARRFRRLVPLYTFIWILSLVFISDLQLDTKRIYLSALAYVSFLYPFHPEIFFPPGNWVMWSIGVEVWFSVLFPLLMIALARIGWRGLVPAVLIFALTIRLIGQLYVPASAGGVLNFVSDSVFGRLDEFVLGMLAAHLYCTGRSVPRRWFYTGLLLIGGAELAWAGAYHGIVPNAATVLAVNLLDLGIFLCVLDLLLSKNPLSRLLQANWLQLLGMMCYSVYLWHGIVRKSFQPSFHNGVTQYASYLLVVLVLSFITYRYIEFRNVRSWRDLIPGLNKRDAPAQ